VSGIEPRYPVSAAVFQDVNVHNCHCRNAKRAQGSNDVADGLLVLGIHEQKRGITFFLFGQAVVNFRVKGPIIIGLGYDDSVVKKRRDDVRAPESGALSRFVRTVEINDFPLDLPFEYSSRTTRTCGEACRQPMRKSGLCVDAINVPPTLRLLVS